MRWAYLMQIYNIAKAYFQFPFLVFILALIGTTYLVKNKKKITGFAIKWGSYLHFIAVDKNHRGKGLGRDLLLKILPKVKSLRVNVTNVKAIELYQSMGFEIVKTQRRITGLQYLMRRANKC